MNIKRLIPRSLKYLLIFVYVLGKCLSRGKPSNNIALNLSGVLPSAGAIVHGGKVKLLHLRERFGETWKKFNIAYFASSGLPFAPSIWLKLYKLFGIKIVWNQNGVAYPALYSPEIVKRINDLYKPINLCDYAVYQTDFCKRAADRFATKFNGQYSILINPVDTKHFKPRETPLPQEPLVIIMSGNHFESQERMDTSLEAVRKLRDEDINVKLVIIGKADFEVSEDWVEMKGAFTQEDAPLLYQSAHILLHLKYLDPCPTIVLEALACGLPVVASASGGLPEIVSRSSGVLLPIVEDFEKLHYPNPSDVADAILRICNNLEGFSRSAREQALKFDKDIWLEKHEEIFNNLLK
jgi:glycosyltransferase involved in cell wall biosynthesis